MLLVLRLTDSEVAGRVLVEVAALADWRRGRGPAGVVCDFGVLVRGRLRGHLAASRCPVPHPVSSPAPALPFVNYLK